MSPLPTRGRLVGWSFAAMAHAASGRCGLAILIFQLASSMKLAGIASTTAIDAQVLSAAVFR